ncbi:uncharacterized protein O3C94_022076 [Discoglossus pictus]
MNKYRTIMRKIAERILNHTLEIIYLLTGEVPVLQHLTNSLIRTEMKKDKKKTEMILNHTLEIIYLLTGEEYTVVKNSPQSSLHHRAGEFDPIGHKEMMNERHHRSSGLQDESVDSLSNEEDDEMDEKDILQVTIHPDLCVGSDEMKPLSLSKEDQEEDVTSGQPVKEEQIPVNISGKQ